MVAELDLPIDVVELDTQLFFRESYDTRDRLRRALRAQPDPAAGDHRRRAAPPGGPEPLGARPRPLLRDPQGRAAASRALEPYDAWASGIRRDQSPSRADTPKVEWSERYGVWKLHPLADWDEKRVWAYIHVNEIPYNPLHETGYRSIGCIPCTRPTSAGARRSAQAAGPAPTSSSAASTYRRKRGVRMTENIHAHEHPESDRVRAGRLHPLVHRPLRVGQVDDRARDRARARQARPGRRVPRRRLGAPAPLQGPRVLEGGPRHEHRADRLGRLAAHAPGRRRDRRRDLPVPRDPREGARAGRAVRPASSRSSSRPRSTSARAATSTASTRRRSPARSRASRASTTRTRRRRAPRSSSRPRARRPRSRRRS